MSVCVCFKVNFKVKGTSVILEQTLPHTLQQTMCIYIPITCSVVFSCGGDDDVTGWSESYT